MQIPKNLARAMLVPAILLAVMWSIEAWDVMLSWILARGESHRVLDGFGIRPREVAGLPGIVLAPFLHGDVAHLLSNTVPLLVLSFILALTGLRRFFAATGIIMLVAGLGAWTFGRAGSVHIGASGVVFGYLGFLLVKGFIERKALWIAVSLVLAFSYKAYLFGLVFQQQHDVSHSSHIFGFLGGILAAWLLAPKEQPNGLGVAKPSPTTPR